MRLVVEDERTWTRRSAVFEIGHGKGPVPLAILLLTPAGERDMNRVIAVGALLTVASLVGYGVGVLEAYPGRALTVTGMMVGISFLAVGTAERHR